MVHSNVILKQSFHKILISSQLQYKNSFLLTFTFLVACPSYFLNTYVLIISSGITVNI